MEFKILKRLIIFALVLIVSSCKKNADDEILKAEEITDVSYGAHELNKLDVYLPEGRSDTTKLIILLHGGWWVEGDKEDLAEQAMYLRDKGFAVVSMNYRLVEPPATNTYPAQKDDITAAVNFISSKVNDWRISPDKFGMLGVSAGAHLALLYTYAHNNNGKIKTVVSVSGPASLIPTPATTLEQAAAVGLFLGTTYQDNPSFYIQASPVAKVSSLSKSTLILHGENDEVVPVSQAEELAAKLELFDVEYEIVKYPGAGHELLNALNTQEIYDKIELWFTENIE